MSNDLIYLMNSPFQPSPVYSSAPLWKNISEEASNIEDRVFKVVKLREKENRYQVGAAIQNAAMESYTKSLKFQNPNASAEFFKKDMENRKAEIFKNVDSANLDYANKMFQYHFDRYNLDKMRDVARYNGQVMRSKMSDVYTTHLNSMANTLRSGDLKAGAVLRGQTLKILNQSQALGANPTTIANERIRLTNQSYTSAALGLYEIAKKNGDSVAFRTQFNQLLKKGFGKGFEHPTQYLSPQDIQNIKVGFARIDREYAINSGLNDEKINSSLKNILFSAGRNGSWDQNLFNQIIEARPQQAETYINQLNSALKEHTLVTNATSGNLEHLQNFMAENALRIEQTGNLSEMQMRQKVQKRLKELHDLAIKDTPTYLEALPQYQKLYKLHQSDPSFNKYAFRLNAEKTLGLPLNVLSKTTVDNIADKINGLSPTNGQVVLSGILDSIPEAIRPYAEAQLRRSDKDIAGVSGHALLVDHLIKERNGYTPLVSRALGKNIDDFLAVKNHLITSSDMNKVAKKNLIDDSMLQSLQNMAINTEQKQVDYASAKQKIALELMQEKGISDYKDAYEKAGEIMHSSYKFYHYMNNGYTIRVPKDVSKIKLFIAVDRLKNSIFSDDQIEVPPILQQLYPTLPKQKMRSILFSGAHWVNHEGTHNTNGDGLMLVYQDNYGNKIPITKRAEIKQKDGKTKEVSVPVLIPFSSIRNGVPNYSNVNISELIKDGMVSPLYGAFKLAEDLPALAKNVADNVLPDTKALLKYLASRGERSSMIGLGRPKPLTELIF